MVKLKLYGMPESPDVYEIRDFLMRGVVDFEWIEVKPGDRNEDPNINYLQDRSNAPAILFPDGEFVVNPTREIIAKRLGWINKPALDEYDLAIYGGGPAGLSAAVYAASEGLKTILVEREAMGGQAGTSSLIENYMGFPQGISGAELAERARQQALKFGVEILLLQEGIKGCFKTGRFIGKLANGDRLVARTNLCTTGIEYDQLNLAGESNFFHKGVYYGAGASEACFCKGKDVFIVGGGNSAGQAASYFSGFARMVYMVVRKPNLQETLSDYLVKRVTHIPNIRILYNSEVSALDGDESLKRIKVTDKKAGSEMWYETSKLFICIGGKPNTEWAAEMPICRDENGYLITGSDLIGREAFTSCWKLDRMPYHLETSVPGSFAAGDVRHGSVKRVASAVGEGAMAITLVHKYLSSI